MDAMITEDCVQVTADWAPPADAPAGTPSLAAGDWLSANSALLGVVPPELLNDRCSPHPIAAVMYYCFFVVACALVLVNLIVGAIVDQAREAKSPGSWPLLSKPCARAPVDSGSRWPHASRKAPIWRLVTGSSSSEEAMSICARCTQHRCLVIGFMGVFRV